MPIIIEFDEAKLNVQISQYLESVKANLQRSVLDALTFAASQIEQEASRLLKEATSTWATQPNIVTRIDKVETLGSNIFGTISIYAGSPDDIFNWVDKGTPAHDISPKGNNSLIFPMSFTPKSHQGSLQAGEGFKGSPYFIGKVTVHNPGIEGRDFMGQVATDIRGLSMEVVMSALQTVKDAYKL